VERESSCCTFLDYYDDAGANRTIYFKAQIEAV
jgi:hypothetical protein